MNTTQLQKSLGRICKNMTHGVYARDALPEVCNYPAFFIVNTDTGDKPGLHWIALHLTRNRGEYFDSYGREPERDFIDYMNTHCDAWFFSNKQLQSAISAFCGMYCLFYIHLRCSYGHDLNRFLDIFSNDTSLNDALVHKFVCKKL